MSIYGAVAENLLFLQLLLLEEVHRRFSPTLLLYAMCSVASGCMVNEALCIAFSRSSRLFHFGALSAVPLRDLWLAPVVGLLTGLLAAGFSKGYVTLRSGLSTKKLPFWAKLVIVFVMMGVVGVFLPSAIGSGHALIDTVAERQLVWWVLLVLLVVKFITVVAVGDTLKLRVRTCDEAETVLRLEEILGAQQRHYKKIYRKGDKYGRREDSGKNDA